MVEYNIGFDFHGVLNKYPMKFHKLMEDLIKTKNNIYIISGPPYTQIQEELRNAGYICLIHYHHIISVVDYLKRSKAKMYQDAKGDWWTDNDTWWKSKANICKENSIQILYDDKIEYSKTMDENTLFLHVQ